MRHAEKSPLYPWFFVLLLLFLTRAAWAEEPLDPARAVRDDDAGLLWYDVRQLDVEGQGFRDTKADFDRLPARAKGVVRDAVWNLSRDSAGICVRFVTDASTIHARWTLISRRLAMPHMAATGVSGLDLYVKADDGRWRWLATGRPTKFPENNVRLVTGITAKRREYRLYLPLYNGVSSVALGVPAASHVWQAPPRDAGHAKPLVFYGTSITQGGCASRPGMVHTAILGRRLDRPVINAGFSGNGRMEAEVGRFLAEIDAAVFVIDCLPNLNPAQVAQRTEPLVRLLRQSRPDTPILLVEDRSYANAYLVASSRQRNEGNRKALRAAYERLVQAGVKGLYYLDGAHLIGDDSEGTVDGSHPTDLGFVRQSDAFEPILRKILQPSGSP